MASLIRSFCLLLPVLLCAQGVGAHTPAPLTGPAFTEPAQVYGDMPPGWADRPLAYDTWAHGADLAVTLDQQLYPMLRPVIRTYAHEHGLRIAIERGTCGISAGALSRKEVDVGGFCCPPSATDRLPGLRFHTLGIGALAVFVHPDNPVEGLTQAQVRAIYRGRLRRWSQTGAGPDSLVHPVARLHCKARPGHWRLLLDDEDLFAVQLREVGTIPDMLAAVAADPAAIGYETLWMVNRERDSPVKVLPVDGYAPTDAAALAAHRYPFYRTFNLTTWSAPGVRRDAADALVAHLMEAVERVGTGAPFHLVPAARLREQGWRFHGAELVGEPGAR